jgi:hypothetical protein
MLQQVTGKTLQDILNDINGAEFAAIDTMTVVPLLGGKKNPMQGRVIKRSEGCSVMLFTNQKSNAYAKMVARRLEKEGKDAANFTLGPRTWGERIPNTPFVQHIKDGVTQMYLEVIFMHGPKRIEFLYDGKPIAREDVIGLKADEPNEESQGGLENKVIVRTFKCENIKRIRTDRKEYIL